MIETKLGFLQVQVEGLASHAIELRQTPLGEAPEALNAIDMHRTTGELIGAMTNPKVFVKAHIHQAVIAAPAVGVNDTGNVSLAPNDGLQGSFGCIGHDLGVDALAALEQTEHDGLAARAASAQSAHPLGAEVRLIGFKLTGKRRQGFAVLGHARAHAQIDRVDRAQRHTAKFGAVCRGQIHGEVAHDLAKLRFAEFGTPEVFVFLNHNRKLDHRSMKFAS